MADAHGISPQDGQSFASVPASQLHVSTAIKTSPEIDFDVKTISVSCNGHYLLLVGYQGQVRSLGDRKRWGGRRCMHRLREVMGGGRGGEDMQN